MVFSRGGFLSVLGQYRFGGREGKSNTLAPLLNNGFPSEPTVPGQRQNYRGKVAAKNLQSLVEGQIRSAAVMLSTCILLGTEAASSQPSISGANDGRGLMMTLHWVRGETKRGGGARQAGVICHLPLGPVLLRLRVLGMNGM